MVKQKDSTGFLWSEKQTLVKKKRRTKLVGEDIDENEEKRHPESFSNVYGVSNSCGLEKVRS